MKKILYKGHTLTTEPPPYGEWECHSDSIYWKDGSRLKRHICYMPLADLEVHQNTTKGGHQTCQVRCSIGQHRTIMVEYVCQHRIRSVRVAKQIAKMVYEHEVSGQDPHVNANLHPEDWEIK